MSIIFFDFLPKVDPKQIFFLSLKKSKYSFGKISSTSKTRKLAWFSEITKLATYEYLNGYRNALLSIINKTNF